MSDRELLAEILRLRHLVAEAVDHDIGVECDFKKRALAALHGDPERRPHRPALLRYSVHYEVDLAGFADRNEAARWAKGHGGGDIQIIAPDAERTHDRIVTDVMWCESCDGPIWDDDDPDSWVVDPEDPIVLHARCVPEDTRTEARLLGDDSDDEGGALQ